MIALFQQLFSGAIPAKSLTDNLLDRPLHYQMRIKDPAGNTYCSNFRQHAAKPLKRYYPQGFDPVANSWITWKMFLQFVFPALTWMSCLPGIMAIILWGKRGSITLLMCCCFLSMASLETTGLKAPPPAFWLTCRPGKRCTCPIWSMLRLARTCSPALSWLCSYRKGSGLHKPLF